MTVDFSVIQDLALKEAFNNEEKIRIIETDEDYLNELFEHSQKAQLFVYDDEDAGYSRFVSDTNGLGRDKTISIDNSNHKDVFLMRIDGMLFQGMSKCDCALLSQKDMFFIELKNLVRLNIQSAINSLNRQLESLISITRQLMRTSERKKITI